MKAERWIEVVQVGGKGGVNAYVINSRVAWASRRDNLPNAIFTATVLAQSSEQEKIETAPLRRIPSLYPGERQIPLSSEEPTENYDLPSLRIDKDTGEIFGGNQ